MREEVRNVVVKGEKGSFPSQTKVYVCRKCGREVAVLSFAYVGESVLVKGEENGKVE